MDINLEGEINSVETAERIRTHHQVPAIYLTAYSSDSISQSEQRSPNQTVFFYSNPSMSARSSKGCRRAAHQ